MIKGLYSAFTALEAAWRYQDVLSNNIANANTPGFKREIASQESFADVLLSRQTPVVAPLAVTIQQVIGQIGTGTFIADFATDFQEGNFKPTANELNMATSVGFFAIETGGGARFYTRDGSFVRNSSGDLVNGEGYYVLDPSGGRINVPADKVEVSQNGVITTEDGAIHGTVGTFDFKPAELTRAGQAFFTATAPATVVSGGIRQGLLEESNTDLLSEMTTMMAVQRTFQANQTILARLDENLNEAAGSLGTFGG